MIPAVALSVTLMLIAVILFVNAMRMLTLWAFTARGTSLDEPFFFGSAAFLFFTLSLVFAQ